ncbi:MAG: hypothetical protein KJI71_00780 [Patescibacteria group bacterium]|nr:hypothetical protein [Patescibacteria group bacterium]
MKPLFETSQTGSRISVYPDYVAYKLILSGEKTIAINHIVSVETSRFLGQVTIETTAGKRIKIPVKANDQNKLRDAIYQSKREFGQVKQNQRGDQEKPLSEIPEQAVLEKPSKKKSNPVVLTFLIILIIFIFKSGLTNDSKPSSPSSQSNQGQESKPTEGQAGIIAKKFVKAFLKSPSTAKFPGVFEGEPRIISLPDVPAHEDEPALKNRFRVVSYVDAQNSFGAMIRSNWFVTLNWDKSEGWQSEEIILDDEVVYSIY